MPVSALSGPQYLREGLRLVLSPGLRLFVILPLTVNVLLFFGLIWLAVGQFSGWVDTFMPSLPNWLAFLEYLLWPLFVALVVLMVFFTFTMLANIIAAPFNGFLSEKVEVVVRGEDAAPPFSWAELLAMLPRTIGRGAQAGLLRTACTRPAGALVHPGAEPRSRTGYGCCSAYG